MTARAANVLRFAARLACVLAVAVVVLPTSASQLSSAPVQPASLRAPTADEVLLSVEELAMRIRASAAEHEAMAATFDALGNAVEARAWRTRAQVERDHSLVLRAIALAFRKQYPRAQVAEEVPAPHPSSRSLR